MMHKIKHVFSFCIVAFFSWMAIASKVNKVHYGAFNYNNQVEPASEGGNFLLMMDGTKVFGDKIKWKSGLLTKDEVSIDDQKFKLKEVRGYLQGSVFYGRLKNDFIQRIVHGDINVYVKFTQVTETSTSSTGRVSTRTYTRTDHYGQKGDTGEMEPLAGQKDMKRMVAGCSLAEEMCSLSNGKMRKAIKKDRNYLNKIFETYNNHCEIPKYRE
ncbi:MAG TPA: hypothetical protein PKK69_08370 [Ferruginibacter sp.]|nr:hypothetical protein [Ferruginibacter sp.]